MGGSVRDADVGAGIGLPMVGRNVTVNWFSGVQGSIVVGDNVVFGPGVGAVVGVPTGMHMSLRLLPKHGEPPPPAEPPPRAPHPCPHGTWQKVRADVGADIDRFIAELRAYAPPEAKPPRRISAFLTNPLLALATYRISHYLHVKDWRRIAMWLPTQHPAPSSRRRPAPAWEAASSCPIWRNALHGYAASVHANTRICAGGRAMRALATTCSWQATSAPRSDYLGDGAQLGPGAASRDIEAGCQVGSARPWQRPRTRRCAGGPTPGPGPPTSVAEGASLARNVAAVAQGPRASGAGRDSRVHLRPARAHLLCLHATGRRRRARFAWLANIWLTGADITPGCEIGGGLLIAHPAGAVLHCRAGEGLTLGATAGITASLDSGGQPVGLELSPLLGERVSLAHHTGIFGAVKIGDEVQLQPGCVATQSVPAGVALMPRRLRLRTREAVEAMRSRLAAADQE
jgi:serine acetyltransferase